MLKLEDYKNLKQGSLDWHKARRGRFSGDGASKLICKRTCRSKGQRLSQGAQTYVAKKVGELVYPMDLEGQVTTWKMERGQTLEPLAREAFALRELVRVEHWGFRTFCDWGGVSGDGIAIDRHGVRAAMEIKCRESKDKHLNGCRVKDWASLEKIDPQAHWQLQYMMLVHGIFDAWYIAYDDRPTGKNKHLRLHAVRLGYDQARMQLLCLCLWNAVQFRNQLIKELKIQF